MNSIRQALKTVIPGPVKAAVRDFLVEREKRRFLRSHRPQIERIKDLLIGKDNPVIVEIGAQHFLHTRIMLEVFKDARIYCFEPLPGAPEAFEREIANRYPRRCTFIHAAVGRQSGEAELSMAVMREGNEGDTLTWDGAASIKPVKDFSSQYPGLSFPHSVRVKVVGLDDWLNTVKEELIDFVWTDVQGAERDLIEGGSEFLKIVRFIQMEYGECGPYPGSAMTRTETLELMEKRGFQLAEGFPQDSGERGDLVFENSHLCKKTA